MYVYSMNRTVHLFVEIKLRRLICQFQVLFKMQCSLIFHHNNNKTVSTDFMLRFIILSVRNLNVCLVNEWNFSFVYGN
jgi:hypothetical protein